MEKLKHLKYIQTILSIRSTFNLQIVWNFLGEEKFASIMSEKEVRSSEAVRSEEVLSVEEEEPNQSRSTLETVLLMSALSVR